MALITNKVFTLRVKHDGYKTAAYELFMDGVSLAVKAFDASGVTFPFPSGLSETRDYAFVVRVHGEGDFGSVDSDPLVVSVVAGLTKPVLVLEIA
jgi:hypothetical protein